MNDCVFKLVEFYSRYEWPFWLRLMCYNSLVFCKNFFKSFIFLKNFTFFTFYLIWNSTSLDEITIKIGILLMKVDINGNVDTKCIRHNTNMIWHDWFWGLTWMWPAFKGHWLWLPFNRFEVGLKGNDNLVINPHQKILSFCPSLGRKRYIDRVSYFSPIPKNMF